MIAAIFLAAGQSSRMGQPKGLLSWRGKPLFDYQLQQLKRSSVEKIVVVLGHQPENYQSFIESTDGRCILVQNDHWHLGRTSSILKGISHIQDSVDALLFVNLDQPISPSIIAQLRTSFEKTSSMIHIPSYQGRRGHPILISSELLGALHSISEETQGLKSIVREYEKEIAYVEVEDASVLYNFNTPMDYKEGVPDENLRNGTDLT
ncbi:NTP transferase domain-containing protein [Ammoniphilus sp. CFH 90114]|uniref:nucleotidyltransferase family protein n=1 Tax=Ammoniphilus sp. CFH 90114 TaxID=2493665 RepID=UPI00100FFEA5|nr:nucleotidyltransferase family protein [Ammoniphilus sp. CFH 90114]RXT05763.1 nucleotidyltransferase family protein [Ammoniphilus sp. CFH 90114]